MPYEKFAERLGLDQEAVDRAHDAGVGRPEEELAALGPFERSKEIYRRQRVTNALLEREIEDKHGDEE